MKIRPILGIIVLILLYLAFFKLLPYLTDKYHGCYVHQDVYDQSIKSVILDKFINSKNHNHETIIYLGKNNKDETMIFTPEFNGMYFYINVGDSIIKERNSIYYRIKSKATKKDTLFKFYTECKDSLNKRQ